MLLHLRMHALKHGDFQLLLRKCLAESRRFSLTQFSPCLLTPPIWPKPSILSLSFFPTMGLSVCSFRIKQFCSLLCQCSRLGWMGLWTTWSSNRRPCPWQGVWTRWFLKVPSNPNSMISSMEARGSYLPLSGSRGAHGHLDSLCHAA